MVCILDYDLLASASTGFAANLCSNSGFCLKWNVVNKISLNWFVLIQQQTCWLANGPSLFGVKPILNVNGGSLREPSQVAIIISVVCLWVARWHRPRRRGASGAQSVKPAGFNSEKEDGVIIDNKAGLRTAGGHEMRSICHAGWITSYEPDNKQLLFC